ncbi:tRNA dimethylallyltransferase [Homalodisca vitripennis]|nr:tRNA dimethylallyltransferase [Homalodisca vitripennis]
MYVYRGLDIVTNKVTPEELRQVPHHMLDYVNPGQPTKVVDFRDRALPIVSFSITDIGSEFQEARFVTVSDCRRYTEWMQVHLLVSLIIPSPDDLRPRNCEEVVGESVHPHPRARNVGQVKP